MNQYLWLIGVFIAALLGALIGAVPIAALPIMGSLLVALPLTILVAGMFSGLAAAWSADYVAPDGIRRNLVRVVRTSMVAAVVLAVLFVLLLFWLEGMGALSANLILLFVPISAIILSVVGTFSTWRSKSPQSKATTDLLLTLGFIGTAGFVIMWATGLGSLLSQFAI